ncbi:hypothetical protein BGZ58_006744 [Dissophora ornata]|nr:hypothetical protein BGZ58_006744 [Dissophora ornata]
MDEFGFNISLDIANPSYASNKEVHNVVFVGPAGAGKSRLINFLTNSSQAKTSMLTTSQTKEIHFYTTTVTSPEDGINNWVYNLIDTQGLCDTVVSNEEVRKILTKAIREEVSHLNRIVFVIPHGRIDLLLREALESLITMFDLTNPSRHDKVLVVITRCDGMTQSCLKEVYNDMKRDSTLSKIYNSMSVNILSTNKTTRLDNLCCVGLPDLELLDKDLADVYRPKMERSWKFIWSTLLYNNEGFVPVPTWMQKYCLIL